MKQFTKLAILFAIVFSVGCKKEDPDPVPPIITFMDAQYSADKTYTIVRFEFFDGDGDLGLKQEENSGEQKYNVFIDYYEKVNGVWVLKSPIITWNTTEGRFDTTELHLRMPFLENEANRALEGETKIDLLYDFTADTFRYDISIKDRALHLSNVITTSELVVN
ncbi:MAG: hypothetical protein COA97_04235 [Flavobacteriales bacterium]|nr:MAG: hypothetical protein COA97_04235 [Flavobacteriales bacterium]